MGQALIKDKRLPNLSMLAASQTKDKDALTVEGVEHVLAELSEKVRDAAIVGLGVRRGTMRAQLREKSKEKCCLKWKRVCVCVCVCVRVCVSV